MELSEYTAALKHDPPMEGRALSLAREIEHLADSLITATLLHD